MKDSNKQIFLLLLIILIIPIFNLTETTQISNIMIYDKDSKYNRLEAQFMVNLTEINIIDNGIGSKDVKIIDNYAYILSDTGFKVFDISDPTNVALLYHHSANGYLGHSLTLSGNYAITGACEIGIALFNITNSENPEFLGNFFNGGCIDEVFSEGNIVYAASHVDGLKVISIEDPTNPMLLDSYSVPCSRILIKSNTAYVSSTNGILIFDVSNPSNIMLLGELENEGFISSIEINNNYLFLGMENGLRIVELIDNAISGKNYFINTSGFVIDIKIDDSLLFYTQQVVRGFGVMDLSNITNPIEINFMQFSGAPLRFSIHADLALVSDQANGIRVIKTQKSLITSNTETNSNIRTISENHSQTTNGFNLILIIGVIMAIFTKRKMK